MAVVSVDYINYMVTYALALFTPAFSLFTNMFKQAIRPVNNFIRKIPNKSQFIDRLDGYFISGIIRFHEVTGYNQIDQLKQELNAVNNQISNVRQQVKTNRKIYNDKLFLRASSQKEINELLIRKQSWQPLDLEKFTELYKNDHKMQQAVLDAKQEYDKAESELEDLTMKSGQLMGSMYREEQIWSDKIRQASTWGTWVLMGINIALFVVVQLVLEPWKRRRLVRSFESKVNAMLIQNSDSDEVVLPVPDLWVMGVGVFTLGVLFSKVIA